MSSHANTIRNQLWPTDALAALDALLAENQRLREALERIENEWPPASVDPVLLSFVASMRGIAREALAGDAE